MRYILLAAILIAPPAIAGVNRDKAAADAANNAWGTCVVSAARTFALRAPPSDAVDAAMGNCSNEEQAFRGAVWRWSSNGGWAAPWTVDQLEKQMEIQRRQIHQIAMAAAIRSAPDH